MPHPFPTFEFESPHWRAGRLVAGVDEVGRGPLAGPVFAAAVVFDDQTDPTSLAGVQDSKRLSLRQRNAARHKIENQALGFALGAASVEEIDHYNIREATKLAMLRALLKLVQCARFEHVLTDALPISSSDLQRFGLTEEWGTLPVLPHGLTPIIHGDALSLSIAAASILAKIARDDHMQELHQAHRAYGFDQNKGYGTPHHLNALSQHGPSVHHRRSFEPVKSMLG